MKAMDCARSARFMLYPMPSLYSYSPMLPSSVRHDHSLYRDPLCFPLCVLMSLGVFRCSGSAPFSVLVLSMVIVLSA